MNKVEPKSTQTEKFTFACNPAKVRDASGAREAAVEEGAFARGVLTPQQSLSFGPKPGVAEDQLKILG